MTDERCKTITWSRPWPRALPEDEIHLWRIPLTAETEPAARRRLAHHALRAILAHYLACDPEALRFEKAPGGKPRLASAALNFNLSHSGDWGLVAVARRWALGVDLERRRRVRRPLAIARRFFSPEARARLARCAPEELEFTFLSLWTELEARQKLSGAGLAGPWLAETACHRLSFLLDAHHPASLSWPLEAGPSPGLRFFHFPERRE